MGVLTSLLGGNTVGPDRISTVLTKLENDLVELNAGIAECDDMMAENLEQIEELHKENRVIAASAAKAEKVRQWLTNMLDEGTNG